MYTPYNNAVFMECTRTRKGPKRLNIMTSYCKFIFERVYAANSSLAFSASPLQRRTVGYLGLSLL